jgi:hypothetical protein
MHSAIAEVGVLYATSSVHAGWDRAGADGIIEQSQSITGGHAFAIVAYDEHGFWIQNSWGKSWGFQGFGRISYDDWLANATDTWVARLTAQENLIDPHTTALSCALRGHCEGVAKLCLSRTFSSASFLGNDGQPRRHLRHQRDGHRGFSKPTSRTVTAAWVRSSGNGVCRSTRTAACREDAAIQMVADDRETLLITPASIR